MSTLGQIFGTYDVMNRPLTGGVSVSGVSEKRRPNQVVGSIGYGATPIQGPSKPSTTASVSPLIANIGKAVSSNAQPQTGFVQRNPNVVRTQPNVQQQNPIESPITVSDMYKNVSIPTVDTEQDTAINTALEQFKDQATQRIDENAIRRDVTRRYQAEIDAINKIYAQQLAEAQQQGLGALGSTRAIQARSGLLGSDFAQSQTSNVERQNREIEQSIQAEQSAKISSLLNGARDVASKEIAEKRKAIQEGLQSYIGYLEASQERRQSKLAGLAQSLIDQGIRPDQISPQQIKEIAKAYGVAEQDIATAYSAKQRELAQSQESFTLSEGESRFVYNPTTGAYEQVAMGATKGTDSSLTTAQQTKVDSINAVRAQLANYRQLVENSVGGTGGNQFGPDSAQLRTAKSALEFAIANAVGTGALQAADRAVVQDIIPDPTTFLGAPDRWLKGGKAGVLKSIDEASKIFDSNLQSIQGSSSSLTSGGDVFAERWD